MNEPNSPHRIWRKGSRSSGDIGECIEVARTRYTVVVRDSKDPDGPVLAFDRGAWGAFLGALKEL